MEKTFKVNEIEIGFHPAGYRIDKTASAMNRYTKWDIMEDNQWCNQQAVCFDCLPEQGWIKQAKFDWDKPGTDKE